MSWMLLFIFSLFLSVDSHPWNYAQLGPDIWSDYYPLCAGQSQSPINILTACTIYQNFQPFEFLLEDDEKQIFMLKNNGQNIVGVMDDEDQQRSIRLIGGGLDGAFDFVNFHLHWGENYKSGSEHQINGKKYSSEIHFVFKNPQTSQMAVLGIFIQSYVDVPLDHNERTSHEWQRYLKITETLKSENDSVVIDFNFSSLMGENLQEFWRYQGSLTTPPCTEGIIWTLFKQPIVLMEKEFKTLRDNIYFKDYRNPQPLYHRTVYRNFRDETLTSIPDYNRCLLDSPNEKMQSPILSVINCSSYSVFLLLLIFDALIIFLIFAFCKVRYSNGKKKVE